MVDNVDNLQTVNPSTGENVILMVQKELVASNKEVTDLTLELKKRTAELHNAQDELRKTNSELMQLTLELKDRVHQRIKELAFQNKEKGKRAAELVIADKELVFQNKEKGKRADELVLANKELAFQNEEKEKRAQELSMANKELAFQNDEKEKRAAELTIAKENIKILNTELENRVVERTAQLAAANKELEAFSYSVSHDLRAPLRHTSGYVKLLKTRFEDLLSEQGRHYLDAISESIHQMDKLIDDLLNFSRTGRSEMRKSVLDMNQIVEEVSKQLQQDNPGYNIKWVIAALPSVLGDNAMIHLVWINLLSNALKFSRTRKMAIIEIGAIVEATETIFFVRDNGVGFDMKYAQKLFGIFQRLHSMDEFEGTGIGLANVQRIILRHGGRVWAEAQLDKGAVFYFSLSNCPITNKNQLIPEQ